jgi:hypothetical protein
MPVELGLALYRSRVTKGKHHIHIFESKSYRAQRSTSDVNGLDPQIHRGRPKDLMAALRNIFRQPGPEMLASYCAVKKRLPELRRNAGGGSLFEAAVFEDITVAALVEFRRRIESRARNSELLSRPRFNRSERKAAKCAPVKARQKPKMIRPKSSLPL